MTPIQFTIPLIAAHALLKEAVFARGTSARFDEADAEFQVSDSADETRVGCSARVARFILRELRRVSRRSQFDVELSLALNKAAIIVQRAVLTYDALAEE
jgi:hypothetical protein